MAVKIGMVSLGCSKNQIDAERILAKLQDAGYKLVGDAALADISIINTCGFIQSAKEEAIETILEFVQLKKEGRIKKLVITGCLAERYKDDILTEIPEVDAVIGLGSNDNIVDIIDHILAGEVMCCYGEKEALSITGKRVQTTLPYYAYIKIAEGCNNCCSYCSIPQIRGKFRSVPMEEVIKEAEELAANGVRELVVIAQDTTRYGEDLYGKSALPELLHKLCAIDGFKWIRTLYCYPERITDELLDTIASEPKLVKYLDIPIQHCDGEILRRMNRPGDETKLRELIKHIREKVPGIILRTTLITGFPGETEEQFNTLCEFVKDMRFDRLGCFAYSQEEDTVAGAFDNQLEDEVKQHRSDVIMEQQMIIAEENNQKQIDKTLTVVVEGFDRWGECYFGRSEMDAPDIDGKIFFTCPPERKLTMGDFVKVNINDVMDYDLIGEICDESAE